MLMSQVLWKEELSGQTQPKGLRGVGGNLEGLKVKDQGPGRYSTLGGLLGKGTLDPDSDLRVEEKPAGGGAFQSVDSGSRAHGKPKMGEGG